MIIDFEGTSSFNQSLDLVDPGNVCIKAENDEWATYYLIIKTIRGQSHVLEFGPLMPDNLMLIPNFYVSYTTSKFKEKIIYKKISAFLNDPKKKITSASEDFAENALEDIPAIGELFERIN